MSSSSSKVCRSIPGEPANQNRAGRPLTRLFLLQLSCTEQPLIQLLFNSSSPLQHYLLECWLSLEQRDRFPMGDKYQEFERGSPLLLEWPFLKAFIFIMRYGHRLYIWLMSFGKLVTSNDLWATIVGSNLYVELLDKENVMGRVLRACQNMENK